MAIKRGDKRLFPYLGDYAPVNIYKGENKLSGWKWQFESGKVLQFQNGYKDKIAVEVEGASKQNSGSGKNMFEVGYLSNRDNFNFGTYSTSKKAIQLKGNTKYVFSAKKVLAPGIGKQFVFNIHDGTDGVLKYGAANWSASILLACYNMHSKTVKIPDIDNLFKVFTTPESGLVFFSYFDANERGLSPEGDWFTDRLIEPQLEEGSIATSYEPPAASPDNPIPINSLDKSFDIVSSVGGGNLILNSHYITPIITNNGWVNTYGVHSFSDSINKKVVTQKAPANRLEKIVNIPEKGTYTFSIFAKIPRNLTWRWFVNTSDDNAIKYEENHSDYKVYSVTFDVPKPETITIRAYMPDLEIGEEILIDWEKLEKGEASTPWNPALSEIPYDTQSPALYKTNIQLSEPLRSVGDVKDRVFYEQGEWKVERNVGEITLDGNNGITWIISGTQFPNTFTVHFNFSGMKRVESNFEITFASESLPYHTMPLGYKIMDEEIITNNGAGYSIPIVRIKKSRLSTLNLNGFYEWVAKNPIIVNYKLATPTIEVLPESEQIKLNNIPSFLGENHIYTVANLEPNLRGKMKVWDI